jgi:hypothetical protein
MPDKRHLKRSKPNSSNQLLQEGRLKSIMRMDRIGDGEDD